MASYTDNLQYLTSYQPYIQQLPVDAMVQTGMQRQAQYNEGVQRIQSQIDTVAGLDVVRDVDKQYLQSKLNELGGKLKTVATGDFSNFQLVNSVGGMVNHIAKDKNVLSAVGSTIKYREQLTRMQKDQEEGKYNPANNFRFNKQANNWLNSTNPGESFNTTYLQPIDVWGKVKDIAKEVGIDEKDIQQIYQTDEQGNVLTDKKTGEPLWNPIMAEKILKGKDASKILSAFQSALTPADYEQLAINGEYEKANYTPEMLKSELISASSSQLNFINTKIQDIKIALHNENEKNNKDFEKIASLNSQLEYFQNNSQSIKSSLDRSLQVADTNPDAIRGSLYTNNYLTRMSQVLSSQDESTKYSVSPKFTVTMELNRFNRDIQRDKIADYHWAKEMEFKKSRAAKEDELALAEFKAKYGIDYGGTSLREGIPVEGMQNAKEVFESQYSENINTLNSTNYDIALEYYKKTNKKNPSESNPQYEERMKQLMAKDAGGNVSVTDNKLNEYISRIASKQLLDWSVNKDNVPVEMRGLIEQQDKLSKKLEWQKQKIETIKTKAKQQLEAEGLSAPTDEELANKIGSATISLYRTQNMPAKTITLSKQDVLDFSRIHPNMFNVFGNITTDKQQAQERDKALERLKLKYPNDFERIESELYQLGEGPKILGTSIDFSLGVSPIIRKARQVTSSANYKILSEIESKLYVDEGIIKQPTSIAIERGKDPLDDRNARISSVIDKYQVNDAPGYNQKEMQQLILSNPDVAIKVISFPESGTEGVKHILRITDSKSGDYKDLFIDNNDYRVVAKTLPPVNRETPMVIEKLDSNGTTNSSSDGDPSGAYFTNTDFANFKSKDFTITGDLTKDKADMNKVWFKLYLYNKKTGEPFTFTYPQSFPKFNQDGSYNQQLEKLPIGINEEVIKQIMQQ